MELVRKIGIGVVMFVPGFVFGGLFWHLSGSWWAVLTWEIIAIILFFSIITGKFSFKK